MNETSGFARPSPTKNQDKPLEIGVQYHPDGKRLAIIFNYPTQNVVQHPHQAVALAKALLAGAQRLDPNSTEGFTWPTT